MKFFAVFSRILIGLVFIFSGFVKGVDPLGTAYKITDYFYAYNMAWAVPASLVLSIILCTFEFSLGVLLVLNVRIRLVSRLTLLTMLFFTVITLYDALENPVPDCGCFGDAIILTNWQTFYKNVVLMILVLLMFMGLRKMKRPYSKGVEYLMIFIVFFGFAGFSFYNYSHLPMVDFLAWKVGNRMVPENPIPVEYYIKYKNKSSGEEKEYLSKDIPWQDSAWVADWEYLATRENDPNEISSNGLAILDSSGNDVTDLYISNPDFQFLIFTYDLQKAHKNSFTYINRLYEQAKKHGYQFAGITSSNIHEITEFKEKYNVNFDFFFADDTSIKSIIRANPGFMLMKNGVVLAKWHFRDLPDFDDINFKGLEEKYLK